MNRSLRTYALIAVAAVVVGVLENVFFGVDHAGTAHDVSVGFFFVSIAGILAVLGIAAAAVIGHVRRSHAAS